MADLEDIGNVLAGFGAGVQGTGTQFLQGLQDRNANSNLMDLGSDLANGNIDQAQYLKSIAQYSPETYNKMLTTQMQATPAAVKTFNDIQDLKNKGLEAYKNGDYAKAKDFTDQANLLTGVSRPAYAGANMFSLPSGAQQLNVQPTSNAVTIGNIPTLPGSNVQQPMIPSNNPAASSQAMPANEVLNNTSGQTPAEQAAATIGSKDNIPNPVVAVAASTPIVSPIPQPPQRQPGQTESQHKDDLKTWEDANAAYVSEQKASGGDTVKYDSKISSDAKDSQNVINAIADMRKAQQQIQSGIFAPAQQTMLRLARGVGVDLTPEQLANLNNQQVMTKLSNDILGGVLKNDGQAGRLKSVADSAKAANPNIAMEPEALNALFDYIQTKAAPVIEEQKAWAAAKTANPSSCRRKTRNSTTPTSSLTHSQPWPPVR